MTYVGLVDLLHKFPYAIAHNDFDLRLAVWEDFCFVFNNAHYARYGTYNLNQRLEETHHAAENEIEEYGLSVCRNMVLQYETSC